MWKNLQVNWNIVHKMKCLRSYYLRNIIPSLTVEEQTNGCKASKIKACSRFFISQRYVLLCYIFLPMANLFLLFV